MLRMLDLFAGIGGFSYAGEKLVGGFETVAFCEYDEHAQKVLRKHWPDTEIIGDIRELANDADRFRGMVDIITGGYPCQPFSLAGVRRGDQDDRHLWPEMLRVIQAVRPRWVIGENVAGHISMGLDTVLSDLEAAGYASRCYVIPAVAADAPHRRDRCWIVGHAIGSGQRGDDRRGARQKSADRRADVAHADCVGGEDKQRHQANWQKQQPDGGGDGSAQDVGNANSAHPQGGRVSSGIHPQHTDIDCGGDRGRRQTPQLWKPEPELGRVANGIPGRVHRLRQLGNSIVPQVAARILYAIKEADDASQVRD